MTNRAIRHAGASRSHVLTFAPVAAALLVLCAVAAAARSAWIASVRPSPAAKVVAASGSPWTMASTGISTSAAPAGEVAPTSSSAALSSASSAALAHGATTAAAEVRPVRPHAPRAGVAGEPTASSLFADANHLRGAGRVSDAVTEYRQLQAMFPRSSEALLSRVSCGSLLLGRGEAEASLEQFRAYLSATPSGVLGAEALFGEARAFRAMERPIDEKAAWGALLSTYPESVYAPVARARVEELR